MRCTVIGVAGGTGSGKSTFTNRLKDRFGDDVTILYYDSYYKSHDELPYEERSKLNFDHPDAFETPLLIRHVKELKAGRTVESPVYDYAAHNRTKETVTVKPSPILIVEGILCLQNEALRDMMDIRIYVEADADERIIRRILRDTKERGRDLEGIIRQYLTTVKPMHYAYVEPTRALADIVINSGLNDVAFEIVCSRIEQLLSDAQTEKQ